jgi:hypothetical protein
VWRGRERVLELTAGREVDAVFDTVGGPMFEPALRSLRFPISEYKALSANQFGATSPMLRAGGGTGGGGSCNGFQKEIRLGRPITSPCGWKNKLATEEVVPARTLILPTERLPCGPFPKSPSFCPQRRFLPNPATSPCRRPSDARKSRAKSRRPAKTEKTEIAAPWPRGTRLKSLPKRFFRGRARF